MNSGLYQIQTVFLFLRESARRVRISWFQQDLMLPSEEGQFWFQEEAQASTSRPGPQSESISTILFLFSTSQFEYVRQLGGVKGIPPRKSAPSLPLAMPQTATLSVLFKDSDFYSKKCYIFILKWIVAQEFASISAVPRCGQNSLTLVYSFNLFCHCLKVEEGFPTPLWSPQAKHLWQKGSATPYIKDRC